MIIEFIVAFADHPHASIMRQTISTELRARHSRAHWDFEDQPRDEGFSESEIDELLSVGFFSVMMNMMTDAYEVPWEAPFPP